MGAAKSVVTFSKFPKLVSGEEDEGSVVTIDGVDVGRIERRILWQDVGIRATSYRPTVVGYVVRLWHHEGRGEPEYETLADARASAKETLARLTTDFVDPSDPGQGLRSS